MYLKIGERVCKIGYQAMTEFGRFNALFRQFMVSNKSSGELEVPYA